MRWGRPASAAEAAACIGRHWRPRRHRRSRAVELLDLLGVGPCAGRLPRELSGGEQQRVAIAVALANSPSVILADEPTGELDVGTSQEVFDALRTANRDLGTTVVAVTHDPDVADRLPRTVTIRDGRVGAEGRRGEEFAVVGRDGSVVSTVRAPSRKSARTCPRSIPSTVPRFSATIWFCPALKPSP